MKQTHNNPKKNKLLKKINSVDLYSSINNLKDCLAFSLYFFDGTQKAGQDINQWNDKQKEDLFNKLKEYSKDTKVHWNNARCGSGGLTVLEIYGKFPVNSDFKCPKNIPENVSWARFRLDNMMRLVGFFINQEEAEAKNLSPNIFYIVFLDKDHRFYKMDKR